MSPRVLLIAALSCIASNSTYALQPSDFVENFRLTDHTGASHELYRWSDAKAIAVLVQGNGCPIVRNAMPTFKALRDQFEPKGVRFVLLNSNLQDHRDSIAKEVVNFEYDLPVLVDDTQLIGEALGLIRTGEVFVIDPKTWTVAYHGAVDDRLNYEHQKPKATKTYLADALNDLVAGDAVRVASTKALGCLINFPAKRDPSLHAKISYEQDIAPILLDNCVSCHRDGGIGSWAMTDYTMVRGFAPMIREVLRTQRMPPWHADPKHGHFANDRSLTKQQIQTLVHWIEAGAPRGSGEDPLLAQTTDWPEWALGEPDLIIDIPAQEVPATGTIDYQYPIVRNPLDRDVWVRATEIIPGDRKALHHVITNFGVPGPDGRIDRRTAGNLGGYVPGATAEVFPDGTGVLLPKGAVFRLQMHYTTYGKPAVDESRLGLYFHEVPPDHALEATVLMNTNIRIPPHSNGHTEQASTVTKVDSLLYTLLPHAHYRGKASEFRATYPDGTEEVLLSVPNYDFNWQTTYELEEPKLIPAGTTLTHTTSWDNSATNPANPDPAREVPWGEQSWDEMLFGALTWRRLTEEEVARLKAKEQAAEIASASGGSD